MCLMSQTGLKLNLTDVVVWHLSWFLALFVIENIRYSLKSQAHIQLIIVLLDLHHLSIHS